MIGIYRILNNINGKIYIGSEFMNDEGFTNYGITFENEYDNQYEEISLEEVSDLDVWPNNFIRIEFWK